MATNRYGQIWHGDHHHINIRFPSTEARLKFQSEFEAYHASHDHDGDIPTFKNVSSKDLKLSTGSRSPQDLVKAETDDDYRITLDGYSWNEIHDYHNPSGFGSYFWYHVPTCCVPPIIVVGRAFVDSGTLQRHPLSAIFGDMPDDDFESLLNSVRTDGFIDPIIRIHEGQILDGWHRYRAAQALNLIRKLKFKEWNADERKDGDPKAFVYARNLARRHYSASQRAQVAVTFNERFGHGGNRSKSSNEPLKTQEELAEETKVSKSSIKRAVQVEKTGRSQEVIDGEKSASEIIKEEKLAEQRHLAQDAEVKMWDALKEVAPNWNKDDFVAAACDRHSHWGVDTFPDPMETDIPAIWEGRFHLLRTEINMPATWIQDMLTKMETEPLPDPDAPERKKTERETRKLEESIQNFLIDQGLTYRIGLAGVLRKLAEDYKLREEFYKGQYQGMHPNDLQAEYNTLSAVFVDLQNPNSQIRRELVSLTAEPKADTRDTLWQAFNKRLPKWKAKYTESGYKENDLIQAATEADLFDARRVYRESEQTGEPTDEEIKDVTALMESQSYVFARKVWDIVRERISQPDELLATCEAALAVWKAFPGGLEDITVDIALCALYEWQQFYDDATEERYENYIEIVPEPRPSDAIQTATELDLLAFVLDTPDELDCIADDPIFIWRARRLLGTWTDIEASVRHNLAWGNQPDQAVYEQFFVLPEMLTEPETETVRALADLNSITVSWEDKMVMFNAAARGEGRCGRMLTEIPDTLKCQLLQIAQNSESTDEAS